MLLYDFPRNFSELGAPAFGSIDEVTWIDEGGSGSDLEAVRRGSALYVRGWATNIDRDGSARTIVLQVDDDATYEARVELPRPDVARTFQNDLFARSGFEAIVPTGRIAPGAHHITAFVIDPGTRNYARIENAAAFSIVAPERNLPDLPFGRSDTAGAFDEVWNETRGQALVVMHGCATVARGDVLRIRGWLCALEPAQAFAELYAVVDDADATAVDYGSVREDVAENLGSAEAANAGFSGLLSTIELPAGEHIVRFVARAIDDSLVTSSLSLRLVVGDPLPARIPLQETTAAFIDEVVRIDGSAVGGSIAPLRLVRGDRVFVRGWAFDRDADSLAAGVVLVVDNEHEFISLYGLPRPDIAEVFGNEGLTRSGFSCEFTTVDLDAGAHVADCRVLARDGRGAYRTTQQFSFELVENR